MISPGNVRQMMEQLAPVSDHVWQGLQTYASHLAHWQKTLNLVAPSTLPALWQRHILDSWQLVPLVQARGASGLVDFGSGAGLPGMVLAIAGVDNVHLVEANHRKASFLRFVAAQTGARCCVHDRRAEAVSAEDLGEISTVMARALADLPALLRLSLPFCGGGTRLLLPKGRSWRAEVASAEAAFSFALTVHDSVTDSEAVILELRSLTER